MSRGSAVRTRFLIQSLMCALLLALVQAGVQAAQDERSPQDLLKEAESFQQAGKLDEAIADYRLILKQYPDIAPVRSDLGAALAGEGRYQEAIVEYERAMLLQPLPQIRLNLALAYYKADKLNLAVENLKKVHEEMPADLRPVMLLADCYLRQGRNKDVIALLDPLQAAHDDDMGLIYMLGTALVRDGQVARGQVIIDKILKNGDSAEARLLLGTTELAVHQPQAAIADLKRAIELDPKLVSAHSIYGRALIEAANPDEAQKAFREELSINPNDFDSNLYLGVFLKDEQRYDEALPYLQHALEVRPGDPGAQYQIAATHLAKGDFSAAQRELEALVKASPDFLEAHVSLATLYYRLKRKEDGDRERAIVTKLTAEKQARESADAKQAETGKQN
ncbi:MAG TPA: tetratricopeptide repeat protein [Terriglobia bacterium]|nr:tetratricopeptide repeat protein [Terriglobia bacterium]